MARLCSFMRVSSSFIGGNGARNPRSCLTTFVARLIDVPMDNLAISGTGDNLVVKLCRKKILISIKCS
jgi:hypothetical protein